MTCSNTAFTQSHCGGLKADGYAHHPYDFDHQPTYKFPGNDNVDDQHARQPDQGARPDWREPAALTHAERRRARPLPDRVRLLPRRASAACRVEARRSTSSRASRSPSATRACEQMLQYLLVAAGAQVPLLRHQHRVDPRARAKSFKALQKWAKTALVARPDRAEPRAVRRRWRWLGRRRRWLRRRRLGWRRWRRRRRNDASAVHRAAADGRLRGPALAELRQAPLEQAPLGVVVDQRQRPAVGVARLCGGRGGAAARRASSAGSGSPRGRADRRCSSAAAGPSSSATATALFSSTTGEP